MFTLIAEIVIDLVYVAAVVTAVSCLAYLLTLTARERKELKAARHSRATTEGVRAPARARPARSLRPGIVRHHATPSG